MEARLLYFGDAMCSWCYGFGPQFEPVIARFSERVEPVVLAGGLRPFTTERWDAKMRGYLRETWGRIGAATGQPFDLAILDDETFVYDSEPASRALVTLRTLKPEAAWPFHRALARAFYAEGKRITSADVLADLAAGFGLDRETFAEAFESDAMREVTLDDFRLAQHLGVEGFPTLVLHRRDEQGRDHLALVGRGYEEAGPLIERIERALAQPLEASVPSG